MKFSLLFAVAAALCAGQATAQARVARRPELSRARPAPPALPPHAEPFEFTLPEPPAGASAERLIADLPDPAAVAGLLRRDVRALRNLNLAANALRSGLGGADRDAADACGVLLGLSGAADADRALAEAILDRGRRGEDPTGCVLGMLACGGDRAAAWLTKLCLRPATPAGFSLGVLRACDVCVREPGLGVSRGTAVGLAAALLDARPVADAAADRLARWRAWDRTEDVLRAAVSEDDPDEVRGRAFRVACVRFALACAAAPDAGAAGPLCRRWLTGVRAADADLLRRAELTFAR